MGMRIERVMVTMGLLDQCHLEGLEKNGERA
jgi:hypothetical protein